MKPKQYIITTEDRIKLLKETAEYQRSQADMYRMRSNFNNGPSMKILEKQKPTTSNSNKVLEYYQNVYSEQEEPQNRPILNAWL